jgi:sugar lactone lactonase YvrE
MKRVQLFGLVVGFGTILTSGIAFADDVVKLDIVPGSSIRVGTQVISFGQDPPTSTINIVSITDDGTGAGTLFVAQSDISFAPVAVVAAPFVVYAELRAQSNLTGTYDRHTGSVTATGDFDLKLTSGAPSFNNTTCIIPASTLTLSTDAVGGLPFYSGTGTAVDNTFLVNAIPADRCGSFYTNFLNLNLGLPSPSGANTLALVMRMTPLLAPYHIITGIAGDGVRGFGGDGGPATGASLHDPTGVAVDSAGNVFVADFNNQRIRRVDATTGIITTVAGNGVPDFIGDGGLAIDASLHFPYGVALDNVGNLFIADYGNQRIRRVDATTGIITTVTGNGVQGFSGDGGLATDANLSNPMGVAVDGAGNLFVADTSNHRIRVVAAVTGIITTRSGTGIQGFSGDGPATGARLNNPIGVAVDGAGNIFIADFGNQRIRRVDAVTNIIRTRAGNGIQGFSGDGGPSGSASVNLPEGVAVDRFGRLFIADTNNHRIRLVVP